MEAARFPAYLQPIARDDAAPADGGRRRARRLLSRVDLLHHLDAVAGLAGSAPLSFLAVRVTGLEEVERDRGDVGVRFVVRGVGEALNGLCRGTDIAGELGPASFGVILQGAGATAAAATAARLTHHLNRLAFLPPCCSVLVGAATGTGMHGRRLAWAALETFEAECCGG
ncbi:hypothetical protein [Tepidiforma sp.]|jgi:GGDEF domain-containing protein|uniref:hypothetical protein n=1 Tax=Tepidiforma sp. TaxID=2682230 RepID=UPI0021DBE1BD|nr:hypothetical protein [Tepidiforma sp.]MCX7618106.1 hypothetical protein [Tepidiforma sp.]GIW17584.1 MAG: hypothetical protein KatS3mg064_0741 [Tepidiforma sp.]